MRRFALPIAICLASYGCAASTEPDQPEAGNGNQNNGGALNVSGSTGSGGSAAGTAGTSPGMSGAGTTAGTGPSGTAGTSTGTAGSGSAGSAGAGGAPAGGGSCVMSAKAMGTPPMIDDFEDGNADVAQADGRVGGWYLATDMTGTTTPADGPAMPEMSGGMPGKAVHVTGSGLTGWGASLAASITPVNGCYDASMYTGITVSLKGTGSVFVSVLTAAVRSAPEGMRNHFKKQVTLSGDWTTVTIEFSELTQPGGWGMIVPFDATKIYGIDFGPVTAPPAPTSFDFWVDNLSFK